MSWVILLVAGVFEIGWAIGLKYTEGFTKPLPSVLTVIMLVTSVGLLSMAARTLPIGTAYAVWVGVGAMGAAALGIVLFDEPLTAPRVFFLSLMLVAIVGLKATNAPR